MQTWSRHFKRRKVKQFFNGAADGAAAAGDACVAAGGGSPGAPVSGAARALAEAAAVRPGKEVHPHKGLLRYDAPVPG